MKALKSLLIVGLVLFFAVIFSKQASAEVIAPKIMKLTGSENFSVAGLAPAGSEVLIYLDGGFVGQVEAGAASGSAAANFNFQYQSGRKLADGTHTVMAVAKDKTSLVLSAPSNEVKFAVNFLPAPTLIAPNEKTITAEVKPLVIGLTKSGSLVKIFIDDVYNGRTGILSDESDTANFAYKPFLNLSRGRHKVYAVAEDGAGRVSRPSEVLDFNIELPLPAPIMLKPVVNKSTSLSRPFIVGLAKNDFKIKIYIDKKYDGEFKVKNHPSGTANFAYKPARPLKRGNHLVYAVAEDSRGKKSAWSNIVYFSTRSSAIAESVREEKSEAAASLKESGPAAGSDAEAPVISESSGAIEKEPERTEAVKKLSQENEAGLEKIKNLLGDAGEKAAAGQGLINEGRLNQGKLRLSVVLFILFLVGVVAWLLWVNRELVKERRAQNEAEDKALKDKAGQAAGGQKDKLL